jgi:predicted nuclease of predicted toxin-antitoxin system
MMDLLADENVPRSIVEGFRSIGWNVVWIREIGPGMGDREVIDIARREGRLLLTFDKDFGELALCAGHVQQLGGESPLPNLMEVKG